MGQFRSIHCWAGAQLRRVALALAISLFAVSGALAIEQFRAAWADVFHDGMHDSGQVDTMLTNLVKGHYNAVIVQVLAYMDGSAAGAVHGAYWKSSILPRCSWPGLRSAGVSLHQRPCQWRSSVRLARGQLRRHLPGLGVVAAVRQHDPGE